MTNTEARSQSDAPSHDDHGAVEPAHVDPTHDIDGLKTTLAITGTLGTILVVFWAMTHLFNVMVQVERQKKIADAPTTEIDLIRAEMTEELSGKFRARDGMKDRGKMTIEAAMKAYVEGK